MVRLPVGAHYEIVIRGLYDSDELITGSVKVLAHETKNGLIVLQCGNLESSCQDRSRRSDESSDIGSSPGRIDVNNTDKNRYNESDEDQLSCPSEAPSYAFKCPDCDKSYKSKYTLRRHEREIHSKESWRECDICHREFKREYLFLRHTCSLDNQS